MDQSATCSVTDVRCLEKRTCVTLTLIVFGSDHPALIAFACSAKKKRAKRISFSTVISASSAAAQQFLKLGDSLLLRD